MGMQKRKYRRAGQLGLCCAALALTAAAQDRFTERVGHHLPPRQAQTTVVLTGDLDGDGDVDLFSGDLGTNFQGYGWTSSALLLNRGDGVFLDATPMTYPVLAPARTAAMADLDGDGALDIAAVERIGTILWNDGQAVFTNARLAVGGDAVVAGDVNGDNRTDLVVGTADRSIAHTTVLLNQGQRMFAAGLALIPPPPNGGGSLALIDVDGDGDLDLFIGAKGSYGPQQILLYRNDGSGKFTDATLASLPLETNDAEVLRPVDLDRDGDDDLIVGNQTTDKVYVNDGTGRYTDATAQWMVAPNEWTTDVQAPDIDGDGDPDLVFARDGEISIYDNNLGRLVLRTSPSARSAALLVTAAVADVDADGDLDIVAGTNGSLQHLSSGLIGDGDRLFLHDGQWGFLETSPASLPTGPSSGEVDVACGDLNGDGQPDVVLGGSPVRTLLNRGSGELIEVGAMLPGVYDGVPALGDVDGDGDLDLVLARLSGANRLLLNQGALFVDVTVTRLPTNPTNSRDVLLVDVDGDSDLDLFFANTTYSNPILAAQDTLYINDGSGRFSDATATRLPAMATISMAAAVGDADGDGDVDILTADKSVYFNNGSGFFSGRMSTTGSETDKDIALGDVDGDGDLDVALAMGLGHWVNDAAANELHLNDGTGNFTRSFSIPWDRYTVTHDVAFGDIDEDGDLDLLFANKDSNDPATLVYINDGTGMFQREPLGAAAPDLDNSAGIGLADFDGDGDLDIVLATDDRSGIGNHRLHVNLLRHLHGPHLARLGRLYQLDLYGDAGSVGYTFLSLGRSSIPIPPYGTLGLDPMFMLLVSSQTIPAARVVSVRLPLPRSSALLGLPMFSQGIIGDPVQPLRSRFTNVESTTVIGY